MVDRSNDNDASLSLEAMRAQQMAERRFIDMMASAGVSSTRISQEVLYFLPREFVQMYSEMFYKAFAGKEDGGSGQAGEMNAAKAALGKADGKGLQGLGGAKRKTFKKYWVIADDEAVALKTKIDKRLRVIARDMKLGLTEDSGKEGESLKCGECGRFIEVSWKYCSNCGAEVIASDG